MTLKRQIRNGVFWTSIERLFTQLVQFIIGIVIARIVSPSDFGVLAILMIFINLSQVFIDSGFGKALIQKNNPTEVDCSTVFYFNLLMSVLFYGLLWGVSPLIALFYNMPDLIELIRVTSLIIIINSLLIVPQSIFSINLDFKPLAIANFLSAIFSGIVGVVMALYDFKVWALVGQTLSRGLILVIIQIWQLKWFPLFIFSRKSFLDLYLYGVNLFTSSFLGSLINELNSIVIGKIFKPQELGFYSRGIQFAGLPYYTITSIVYRVLFPSLASVKDDKIKLVRVSKGVIRYVSFLSFPVFLWIVMIAEPMVRLLLTDKWLPAVPIIQIICCARMVTIVAGISVELLNAVGYSNLSLKQDVLKICIRIILIVAAYKFGIIWIAIAELFATIIHFFINTYYPGKMMKYGALSQIKDFMPILISAVLSALLGFVIMYVVDMDYMKIIVALSFAVTSYFGCLYLFKQRDFFELMRVLYMRFQNKMIISI